MPIDFVVIIFVGLDLRLSLLQDQWDFIDIAFSFIGFTARVGVWREVAVLEGERVFWLHVQKRGC